MICSTCGIKTSNRQHKNYLGGIFCDNCRAASDCAKRSHNEWQAQTGNPNFQHPASPRQGGYIKDDERAFQDIAVGEQFITLQDIQYIRMREGFDPDWPLANARRVDQPHLRASFGPWASVKA